MKELNIEELPIYFREYFNNIIKNKIKLKDLEDFKNYAINYEMYEFCNLIDELIDIGFYDNDFDYIFLKPNQKSDFDEILCSLIDLENSLKYLDEDDFEEIELLKSLDNIENILENVENSLIEINFDDIKIKTLNDIEVFEKPKLKNIINIKLYDDLKSYMIGKITEE